MADRQKMPAYAADRGEQQGLTTKLAVGPIPLYHQLELDIAGRVMAGEFRPGCLLPTDQQIGLRYGVSRITVRKALDSLLRQGVITRRRGVGSFVTQPREGMHAVHLTGSLDEFLIAANSTTPRIISLAPVQPPARIAGHFGLADGAQVLRLELVSTSADEPIAHCLFYFPPAAIGRLSEADFAGNRLIMKVVEQQMGVKIVRVSQIIEADAASAVTAGYLAIPEGTPVLSTERIYFTDQAIPMEIGQVYLHTKRYRYQVELRNV